MIKVIKNFEIERGYIEDDILGGKIHTALLKEAQNWLYNLTANHFSTIKET